MITPLGIHVLVEPLEESTTIIMPEQAKGQAEKGVIRGLGSKVEDETLKVGDVVIYRKYSPEEFEADGKTVYLVEEADLMGLWT